MVISKVIGKWMIIKIPDDDGRFRVTFEVNKEQDKVIQKALNEVLKEKGVALGTEDWYATRKVSDDGVVSYCAKCSKDIKRKDGTLIGRALPVYNNSAIRYREEEVPTPANGALINIEVRPYFVEFKKKRGVMLNLRSVQLLRFEEYASPNPYHDESSEYPNASQSATEPTPYPVTSGGSVTSDGVDDSEDIFE